MSRRKRRQQNREQKKQSFVGFLRSPEAYEMLCCDGYTSMDKVPEIVTACRKIATLISSMTIHLMENGPNGDQRIVNELSKKIDIDPFRYMTRRAWMEAIVMNMLLHCRGNAIVKVHTQDGLLGDLEPVTRGRFGLVPDGYGYYVNIDGQRYEPDELLHFIENPDPDYPWMGRGATVSLQEIVHNLRQAAATEKGFLESKWKPSIIVKVDSIVEGFSTKEGRKTILKDYVESAEAGEPWLLPAEQFEVEQIKPLSLQDLAIKDTVELNRRLVAAVMDVPPFILGVGEYNRDEWNNFIQGRIAAIVKNIEQEMTRKLILSPKWYLKFNILSLMDWDIKTISDVFGGLSDRGIVTGNEVRDRLGMSPHDDLDELRILENYIPSNMIGEQKKLVQEGAE